MTDLHNAKIVCTLGPSSEDRATIDALAHAGMSVARLNASHGTPEDRATVIERVKSVDDATESPVAVMLDLPGPEVRTAEIDAEIHIEEGSEITYVVGDEATPEEVGLSVSITTAAAGDRVLLDDGRIETVVTGVDGETVSACVETGGDLGSRKGVNVPGVDLDLDIITERDQRELEMAADREIDFVASSFVGSAEDVYAVEAALDELGMDVPIIAKIERADAVSRLEGIVEAAYGIMVARGDLGVECPMQEVPMIQKRIIGLCRDSGTPVITATEMLDSMTTERRPTRAEASDVANAVLDGTDAVMLSGETAVGSHPVRVVETMADIIDEAEASEEYATLREDRVPDPGNSRTDVLARSARYLARDLGASAVVAATESGYTALKSAKYRPDVPVVATTPSERVRRRLTLSWGTIPRHAPFTGPGEGTDTVIRNAAQAALDAGVAESGDTVVVLAGLMTELERANTTNMLKIHVAAEIIAGGRPVVAGRATGPIHRFESGDEGDLTGLPEGTIVCLARGFDAEFTGDTGTIAGIVDAHEGMTGYGAMVARELDCPLVGDATLPETVLDGTTVTIDGERGVVYEGDLTTGPNDRENSFDARDPVSEH
jgi:pyruvate kinase